VASPSGSLVDSGVGVGDSEAGASVDEVSVDAASGAVPAVGEVSVDAASEAVPAVGEVSVEADPGAAVSLDGDSEAGAVFFSGEAASGAGRASLVAPEDAAAWFVVFAGRAALPAPPRGPRREPRLR